ncbi:MAG: flagellar assembly protein FliH [Methylococcales bacterium]|nr:flagellar assembly protein FliH [Methylococcales bacterium]
MSLSKGQAFSESELKELGLWDAAEQFGKKRVTSQQATKKKVTLSVDDIENMQKQAYDEAFAQGQKEGFELGIEEGRKKGFDQGVEQGQIEGEKKGYDDNKHLLQEQASEFVSLLESLSKPFKELDEQVEQELVDLAIGIARQLIRRAIHIDSGQVIAVIREAVTALPIAEQKITIHLHPEDAELVRTTLAIDEFSIPWKLIEDIAISRGGCKVLTETSVIDATVENKLAAIVATVMGGEREEDKGRDSVR